MMVKQLQPIANIEGATFDRVVDTARFVKGMDDEGNEYVQHTVEGFRVNNQTGYSLEVEWEFPGTGRSYIETFPSDRDPQEVTLPAERQENFDGLGVGMSMRLVR